MKSCPNETKIDHVDRERDVEASTKLCEQAQSCFSFVDREGLADATADVYAAVRPLAVNKWGSDIFHPLLSLWLWAAVAKRGPHDRSFATSWKT